MPTKRTRTARGSTARITPEIVSMYKRGLELWDLWVQCGNSDEDCTHSECEECSEIAWTLHRHFRLAPHQPPPLYDLEDSNHSEGVIPIKDALEAALKEE